MLLYNKIATGDKLFCAKYRMMVFGDYPSNPRRSSGVIDKIDKYATIPIKLATSQ
jgi:hypothetical protein